MAKKNKPKNTSSSKQTKKKTSTFLQKVKVVLNFIQSKKAKQIFGYILLAMSFSLIFSFISFLFTWQEDQDKILADWQDLIAQNIQVKNKLGLVGAYLSYLFILNGFGITAFLIPIYFFVLSLKLLLNKTIISPVKLLANSLFFIFWGSMVLAYFSENTDYQFMGGAMGFYMNNLLYSLIGKLGTLMLLISAGVIYALLVFNLYPEVWIDKISQRINAKRLANEEETHQKYEVDDELNPAIENIEDDDESNIHIPLDIEDATPSQESGQNEVEISLEIEETPEENDAAAANSPNDQNISEKQTTKEKNGEEIEFSVEEAPDKEKHLSDREIEQIQKEEQEDYDPKKDLSHFKLPPVELLNDYGHSKNKVSKEELEANKNKIVQTLKNYNIEISSIKATIGPTVTLYEIVPAPGIRISKIKNLEDDIALSLAALGIRIIAPIPGRGTIGIEVPNRKPDIVSMREVISSEKFQNAKMELPLALGKTISNETYVVDLAKMPHLLMAGATGQGKSVGLNVILTSLLYKKHPSQVKFVLVDPKKVELTLFNKIERHYLAKLPDSEEAIITDNNKVINTLNSLCIEMDDRYELLKDAHVRNIKEYNQKFIKRKLNPKKGHRYLPYIVLVVDEFADLIMTAGKEVEMPIARLAQLARAIGIHLIIATQRPSVNVITGTIKANFPARMAFRVTSKIDSKTILDRGGAEQLIGRGDMLLSLGQEPVRIQCAFVDTPEVEAICEYIGEQQGYTAAFNLPEYVGESGDSEPKDIDVSDRDKLFEEAARVVVIHQQGSASLLQRKLKIGFGRAGRIIDQLEAAGIVGPFEGSKARQVLIPDEYALEQFLEQERQTNKNS